MLSSSLSDKILRLQFHMLRLYVDIPTTVATRSYLAALTSQTLGSWVRFAFETRTCMYVHITCIVLSCADRVILMDRPYVLKVP